MTAFQNNNSICSLHSWILISNRNFRRLTNLSLNSLLPWILMNALEGEAVIATMEIAPSVFFLSTKTKLHQNLHPVWPLSNKRTGKKQKLCRLFFLLLWPRTGRNSLGDKGFILDYIRWDELHHGEYQQFTAVVGRLGPYVGNQEEEIRQDVVPVYKLPASPTNPPTHQIETSFPGPSSPMSSDRKTS